MPALVYHGLALVLRQEFLGAVGGIHRGLHHVALDIGQCLAKAHLLFLQLAHLLALGAKFVRELLLACLELLPDGVELAALLAG